MDVMVSRYNERVNRGPMQDPIYVDTVVGWTEHGSFTMGYRLWVKLFGVELERLTERRLVKVPAAAKETVGGP